MKPAGAPSALLKAVLLSKRWRGVGERYERDLRAPVTNNYVCTGVRTCMCPYRRTHTRVRMHICEHTGTHVHMCARAYVTRVRGACVYMHTCVNTHMYVSAPLRACL